MRPDCGPVASKIFFFFFFGGFACFVPYVSVYLRQLGLLPYQAGVISGTQPFLTFMVKPVFGAAADRFDKHKQTLILCLLLSYCPMFCTKFVPPVIRGEPADIGGNGCFPCDSYCGNSSSPDNVRLQFDARQNTGQELCNCSVLREHEIFYLKENDNKTGQSLNSTALQLRCLEKGGCFVCPCNTTERECNAESWSEPDSDTNLGRTFWILFFLLVPATSFFYASMSQSNAHTMHVLGDNPSDFGKHRMWGAVAWGLVSVISGLAMDTFSEGQHQDSTDYSVAFYMFAGFAAATILTVALGFDKWQQPRPQKMLKSLRRLLRQPDMLLFLAVMFILGSSFGAQITFLFWYLKDMGGSQLLLGLALMVDCVTEIPFLFFSGTLVHRIGHRHVFQLALLCYSVRFMSYSLIPGPWWTLAVEPLHGVTFGAMYPASITYASLIAPPGMEATLQGIVGAVHFGVGVASGALVGGAVFHTFGGVVLFRVYAVVCLVTCVIYWLMPRVFRQAQYDGPEKGQQGGKREKDGIEIEGKDETGIAKNHYANVPCYIETSV